MTVDSRVLAMIKATTAKFLTDTCTIEKRVQGTDDYGGQVNSWQVVATGVACRVITTRTPTEQGSSIGGQEALKDSYRLICPIGTALDVDQRITFNGKVYQVTALRDNLTDKTTVEAVMTLARTT